jgi:hypothetical protein
MDLHTYCSSLFIIDYNINKLIFFKVSRDREKKKTRKNSRRSSLEKGLMRFERGYFHYDVI